MSAKSYKILGFMIGILVIVLAIFLVARRTAPESELSVYENTDFGIRFSYPLEYQVVENVLNEEQRYHFQIIVSEPEPPLNPDVPREGPPAITIDIFQNDIDHLSINDWLDTSWSNFKLSKGKYSSTTLAGIDAIEYTWDGLYPANTAALVLDPFIYSFTVTYLDPGDKIRADYKGILDSVDFLRKDVTETADASFYRKGVAAKDNPGLPGGKLFIVYEEPGKPALRAELKFDENSLCGDVRQKIPCFALSVYDFGLENGKPIRVVGKQIGETVIVRELET